MNHALYCAHLASGRQRAARSRRRDPRRGPLLRRERDQRVRGRAPARRAHPRSRACSAAAGVERAHRRRAHRRRPRRSAKLDRAARRARSTSRRDDELGRRAARPRPNGSRPRTPSSTRRDDYAKRTSQLALGRLEVLRRLAAPEADDVVWIDAIGRTRRLRIAPVEPGGGDRRPPARAPAGDRGVGDARRRAAVPRASRTQWASTVGCRGRVGRAATTTAGSRRTRAGATCRCRRRRRSTGRSRASSTSARTCPIPGRARDAWLEQAGDRLCALVNAAGGRALVLCTSHANVAHFAEVLRSRTDARRARAGRRRRRPPHPLVRRGRDVGARRHALVLGRDRRGRRRRACSS